jgi:hypothetical protein
MILPTLKSNERPTEAPSWELAALPDRIETLLGQVRMRAVLANVFPLRHVVDSSLPAPTENSLPQFPAPDVESENELWSPFAVAM